jgi:hypothetical protein
VWVSGKNIATGSLRISESRLTERTSGQEMEVNTLEEGEINVVIGMEIIQSRVNMSR